MPQYVSWTKWLYSLYLFDRMTEFKQISILWLNLDNIYFVHRLYWMADYVYSSNRLFQTDGNVFWPYTEVQGLTEDTSARKKSDRNKFVTTEWLIFITSTSYDSFGNCQLDMGLTLAIRYTLKTHHVMEGPWGTLIILKTIGKMEVDEDQE